MSAGHSFPHLLTGDSTEAEKVVMESLDSWNPSDEDVDEFLQSTLRAAARRPIEPVLESGNSDYQLPIELRRVLELPPELRRSFVLRVLVGLPSQICAYILEVGPCEISDRCCLAMRRLSALGC